MRNGLRQLLLSCDATRGVKVERRKRHVVACSVKCDRNRCIESIFNKPDEA